MRLLLAVLVTGLHGTVVRAPTTPVCRVGIPCSAPAAGVVLIFSRDGKAVARATTSARGFYAVTLPPGRYAVRTRTAPKIGTGLRPAAVTVPTRARVRVNFTLDTGIR
jgi:Carboxypeptidase regulatory-like domain